MSRLLRALRHRAVDERGVAMVTALLVTIVAASLGATAMQLAVHNTDQSSRDRGRTQSVHAGEAGLDAVLAMVENTPTHLLPCVVTGELTAKPAAEWTAEITYYRSYPPQNEMVCNSQGVLGAGVQRPEGIRVISEGAVGTNVGQVTRTMEMQARLVPVKGSFDKAIVSNQTPNITNSLMILGNENNDGDVLSNAGFVCNQSIVIQGSVYVQTTAALGNSCTVAEDLWVNGDVQMTNTSRVNGDLISSIGAISMNLSSYVGDDATAGTSCTGCTTRVGGTITTNKRQGPPPEEGMPDMDWVPEAWPQQGWTVVNLACTSVVPWLQNPANESVKAVLRVTGACPISFANNMTINRAADVAIFTDGSISVTNRVTFRSSTGSWYEMLLIVQDDASCANGNGTITTNNHTRFENLAFFVYSPCNVSFSNGDSNGRGQLYGETVNIQNNLSFTYRETLIPGNGQIRGYSADIAFIREIN